MEHASCATLSPAAWFLLPAEKAAKTTKATATPEAPTATATPVTAATAAAPVTAAAAPEDGFHIVLVVSRFDLFRM